MSASAGPPYEVVEALDSTTFRLSRRPRGRHRVGGIVVILAGLPPLVQGLNALRLSVGTPGEASLRDGLIWLFANILPVLFVATGLSFLSLGLYMIAGRDVVVATPRDLRSIRKVGPFRWTRTIRRDRVRQLTVVRTMPPHGSDHLATASAFNLRVELEHGRSRDILRHYPHDVIFTLAAELAARFKAMPPEFSDFIEAPPKILVREASDVPTDILERGDQPPESTAIIEASGRDLKITIPARGFWKGSQLFSKVFVFFWCVMTSFLVASFTFAAWTGARIERRGAFPQSNWFLVLFFTPFVLIGIGGLLALVHCGKRWAEFTITDETLTYEHWSWFKTVRRTWTREQLHSVHVVAVENKGEDWTTWTHWLRIEPEEGEALMFLSDRPKAELEWLATTVRRWLHPPSGSEN